MQFKTVRHRDQDGKYHNGSTVQCLRRGGRRDARPPRWEERAVRGRGPRRHRRAGHQRPQAPKRCPAVSRWWWQASSSSCSSRYIGIYIGIYIQPTRVIVFDAFGTLICYTVRPMASRGRAAGRRWIGPVCITRDVPMATFAVELGAEGSLDIMEVDLAEDRYSHNPTVLLGAV